MYRQVREVISIMFLIEVAFGYLITKNIDKLNGIKLKDIFKIQFDIIVTILTVAVYVARFISLDKEDRVFIIGPMILMGILLVESICLGLIDYKSKLIGIGVTKNSIDDNEITPNILWKFKIWFDPKYDINRFSSNNREGNSGIFSFVISLIVIATFIEGRANIFYTLLIAVIISDFLLFPRYLLDKALNTFVITTGYCFDVRYHSGEEGSSHYIYKIADFKNKRQIDIRVNSDSRIKGYMLGDKVVVIHGVISKRVLDHFKAFNEY